MTAQEKERLAVVETELKIIKEDVKWILAQMRNNKVARWCRDILLYATLVSVILKLAEVI